MTKNLFHANIISPLIIQPWLQNGQNLSALVDSKLIGARWKGGAKKMRQRPGWSAWLPSLINYKNMIRAISGALSLALMIMVLRLALPEIADLLIEIIVKSLTLLSGLIDLAISQPSLPQ